VNATADMMHVWAKEGMPAQHNLKAVAQLLQNTAPEPYTHKQKTV
jgi:hypothetical protein